MASLNSEVVFDLKYSLFHPQENKSRREQAIRVEKRKKRMEEEAKRQAEEGGVISECHFLICISINNVNWVTTYINCCNFYRDCPKIKADSLHFNCILIVLSQIQCAGL